MSSAKLRTNRLSVRDGSCAIERLTADTLVFRRRLGDEVTRVVVGPAHSESAASAARAEHGAGRPLLVDELAGVAVYALDKSSR